MITPEQLANLKPVDTVTYTWTPKDRKRPKTRTLPYLEHNNPSFPGKILLGDKYLTEVYSITDERLSV